ncbi:MAG TPA: GDSL-type esterase/lipase family protein [Chitinophagaceae bacterium]|nr:GDSL-type esterase/lipase family protein [Chitinophagaceae bacterium]
MKKIFLFSLLLILIAFMPQKKNKVIFFGDSITEQGVNPGGYIRRIDSLCKAENKSNDYEFIGAGVSGNKIYDLYLRLEDDVLNKNPDIVIIFIGVNDVWHKALLQTGTDPDKFEKFYQAVINKIKAKGSKVILCTPAVIGEKTDFSNEQDGDLNRYSNIIRGLAKRNNLALIDLRQMFLDYDKQNNKDNKESGILTVDRVHLNAKGNEFVAEAMWKMIKSSN